ncbi:MAG: Glutamine amidotransferase class-I, partial [Parcubacteria group bacterium GW2011_GWF2_43_11]
MQVKHTYEVTAEYAWLRQEKRFIRDMLRAGKKVLGICLGAQ